MKVPPNNNTNPYPKNPSNFSTVNKHKSQLPPFPRPIFPHQKQQSERQSTTSLKAKKKNFRTRKFFRATANTRMRSNISPPSDPRSTWRERAVPSGPSFSRVLCDDVPLLLSFRV